jgi:hypothetical protein
VFEQAMFRTSLISLAVLLLMAASAGAAPRNGRIVFGEPGNLSSVRADGTGLRAIAAKNFYYTEVADAPSGRSLVAPEGEQLNILSATDASVQRQLHIKTIGWLGGAAWHGRQIAFQMCEKTVFTDIDDCVQYGVYRIKVTGDSEPEPQRVGEGVSPSWSRDGRSLAFSHSVHPHDPEGNECFGIYVKRFGAPGLRRVLPRKADCSLKGGRGAVPFFSANGKRIFFQQYRSLWSVRLNGSGLRRVVRPRHGFIVLGSHLSPDGRRIVFLETAYDRPGGSLRVTSARRGGRGHKVIAVRHPLIGKLAWLRLPSR